jgi:nitrogen-specific signal transduction histidine kinase
MTPPPTATCLLYSTHDEWAARMGALLGSVAIVRHCDSPALVKGELNRQQERVLLLDLLTRDASDLLDFVTRNYPGALVIAFGMPGSDPMLQARQWDVYATEADAVDGQRLTSLVQRALRHVELASENRLLRQETSRLNAVAETLQNRPQTQPDLTLDIRDFSAAMRHFTNVEALLQRLVDEVASALRVSRVGIFCRTRDIASYRLRAGLRCLEASASLEFGENHPYVSWLSVHTHAVSRTHLDLVRDVADRLMLQDMMKQLGAEVMIPLQSHRRLLGWMFVDSLSSGHPFEKSHLDHLVSLTECVSTALENALLYEEATIQKALAETLLHSIPSGIIAVDGSGIVRWYNESAQTLFGVGAKAAIGRPVEGLGSRLADLLRKTLGEEGEPQTGEWIQHDTQRNLVTCTQRLANLTHCLGAVAVVQDTTDQKAMKEQQDRLDRATFWTELAASLSHEVRNPLVAIKTFAQLLPERYEDKDFQHEFRDLVSLEIGRLNGIVDQIHAFANPPPLTFVGLNPKDCLESCLSHVLPAAPPCIRVTWSTPDSLPKVSGDERALEEAFAHILRNAAEALASSAHGEITIELTLESAPAARVVITIKDNGPGIPFALIDKVFSPFSTTKARGLGLGLPIARRTILDHRGTMAVHSNEFGTLVTIRLPTTSLEREKGAS